MSRINSWSGAGRHIAFGLVLAGATFVGIAPIHGNTILINAPSGSALVRPATGEIVSLSGTMPSVFHVPTR